MKIMFKSMELMLLAYVSLMEPIFLKYGSSMELMLCKFYTHEIEFKIGLVKKGHFCYLC